MHVLRHYKYPEFQFVASVMYHDVLVSSSSCSFSLILISFLTMTRLHLHLFLATSCVIINRRANKFSLTSFIRVFVCLFNTCSSDTHMCQSKDDKTATLAAMKTVKHSAFDMPAQAPRCRNSSHETCRVAY